MMRKSSLIVFWFVAVIFNQKQLGAMEAPRLIITIELIAEYKVTFSDYLKSKESERSVLCSLTDSGRWFGRIMTTAIELASPQLRLGNVKVDEAKKFLNRVFNEKNRALLEATIIDLEKSEHNTKYLQSLFDMLDMSAFKNKDRASIIKAMCTQRHAQVPEVEKLVAQTETGEYCISDSDFFPYAVSNLFAFHILESDITVGKLGIKS